MTILKPTYRVHHRHYRAGAAPWEYADADLRCLCDGCHEELTDQLERVQRAIGKLSVLAIPQVIRFVESIDSDTILRRAPMSRDEAA